MDYTLVTVEKAPGVSVTNRIVELILKNIEEKNLGPGDRLPTERELAARIGVARGTVKSAYKRLEQMNLVRIRQGSGIFVVGDEDLIQITSLPRDSRIGIICRTNVFLAAVKDILLSFGFWEDRIQSFFEMDYTTKTYFPGGIDVLISFADAHIFTNPEFEFRNEEFLAKGGRIIAFHHQIEKGTLIYIQNRVGELLNRKRTS